MLKSKIKISVVLNYEIKIDSLVCLSLNTYLSLFVT